MATKVNPYGLDLTFERAVVSFECTSSRFHGRIGHALEPEALKLEASQIAVQAAHAIARDLGHGPDSSILLLQRLRRMNQEGKVTEDGIQDVIDLLDAADDAGLPDEESVISELTPLLRRRVQHSAVTTAMEDYAQRGDFDRVGKLIERAARLGKVDTSLGTVIGDESFREIENIRHLSRLPTGIMELDLKLDSGPPRGTESVIVGGSGAGKSMFLNHVTANSLLLGQDVLYATLELPVAWECARLKSALTGVLTHRVLDGELETARATLAAMQGSLGTCVVKEFPAGITTVADIRQWVDDYADSVGHPPAVLVVDYGDKMKAEASGPRSDVSSYKTGEIVFEGLRLLAHERSMWCWTASQARRKQDKKEKRVELDDVADSLNKIRVADLVVTIARREADDEILYFIAKYRYGASDVTVGPLPHDWACGRMGPLAALNSAPF